MNNNSITSGGKTVSSSNYDDSTNKIADIKRTQQVVSATTFTTNASSSSTADQQQPRAKIRPHKQGDNVGTTAAKRRDSSSSSGSSGPPDTTVSSQHFDPVKAADYFLSARIERQPANTNNTHISDDVDTRQFCLGYREVVKFIDQLGVAFSFIAKMIRGRLDNIEALVHSDNRDVAERNRTVDRMLQYDAAQGVKKTRKACGSQEMLHLNRSLDFMATFTEKAFQLKDEDKLSGVAVETYNSTLSKHHPFLVRKTIQLALYTLPTKKQMADLLGDIPYEKKVEQITAMTQQQRAVYHAVDALYAKHDLQSIA